MKAIIADRNPKTIDLLRKMLHKEYPQIEVTGCASDFKKLCRSLSNQPPDLLMLDMEIAFQGTKGSLKHSDKGFIPTIFLTHREDVPLSQLTEGLSTVLTKPISHTKLKKAMTNILNSIAAAELQDKFSMLLENVDLISSQTKKIIIKDKETIHVVRISEVLFCEADGGYTVFHLKNGNRILASKGLKVFSEQLESYGFYRIHHSYLVNQTHISRYNRSESVLVLENGITIPVSVRKRENLEALLNNRFFL